MKEIINIEDLNLIYLGEFDPLKDYSKEDIEDILLGGFSIYTDKENKLYVFRNWS